MIGNDSWGYEARREQWYFFLFATIMKVKKNIRIKMMRWEESISLNVSKSHNTFPQTIVKKSFQIKKCVDDDNKGNKAAA